jgi:hypothetical protein
LSKHCRFAIANYRLVRTIFRAPVDFEKGHDDFDLISRQSQIGNRHLAIADR